jgi:glycosyltransferase involved in cell wall biosynthesis
LRVLILSPGADTGGVGIALKRAFDHHAPDWSVRYVRRLNNYIDYPADIVWQPGNPTNEREIGDLYAKADVIHLMESFGDEFPWQSDAPRLIHHHGAVFNRHPANALARARVEGLTSLVSTLDMTKPSPTELVWLPNPCDTTALARLRQETYQPRRKPRVNHSPTSRRRKGTLAFLHGIRRLRNRIELDLIEHRPWAECLARKARGDILFDQFAPAGYALNSIEAWALSLATCSGADPWVLDRIQQTVGFLPFHSATPQTVGQRMGELVEDPNLRQDVAERGRVCLDRFHDERRVVDRLIGIYEQIAS